MSSLSRAIVHHTAGNEFNTTGLEDSKADVRAIQNYHMDTNGWSDIGYHFLVDKFGYTFEGRYGSMGSLPKGAHDGTNTNSFGFNVMGYFHPNVNNVPTHAMMDALYDVIAWRMPSGWSPYGSPGTYGPLGNHVGYVDSHRRVKLTACPGDHVHNPYIGNDVNTGTIRHEINARIAGTTACEGPDAVCWSSGRIDVVLRGGAKAVYQKYYVSGTGWSGFSNLGGLATSGPTISSWAEGRLDIFARGGIDELYQKYFSNGSWSGWGSKGGILTSGADAVSWGSGRIDVVALNTNKEVVHKHYTSGTGWSGWQSLGGVGMGRPTVCSWAEGRIDVFVRGGDRGLYHKWYSNGTWYPAGQTGGWESLGGTLSSAPDAVCWGPGRIDVVARGGGNKIYLKTYASGTGWLSWQDLGGNSSSDPGICSWGEGRLDIFCRGGDASLHHKWYSGSSWSGWESLGGTLY